jgi:hypothetical protein
VSVLDIVHAAATHSFLQTCVVQTNEPVVLGPISEFIGRKKVLHYSFGAFFCEYMSVYNNDAAS